MKTGIRILSVLCLFAVFACGAVQAERIPTERGHWSSPRPMDRTGWHIFRAVVEKETDGVIYTPTSYSIQLVNGKRYRFYCRSTVVEAPVTGSAMITVFVEMGGKKVELAAIEDTTQASKDKRSTSGKTFASVTGEKAKWLAEPLYPRTGPYLQAPRKTVRRL